MYNLNIENTFGKPIQEAQAVALSASESQLGAYGSVLSGWQDTLYVNRVQADVWCYESGGHTDLQTRALSSIVTHLSKAVLTLYLVRMPRFGLRIVRSRR